MNFFYRLLFICTAIAIVSTSIAQDRYPSDPEKFYKEVEKTFNTANKSKATDLLRKFEPIFLEETGKNDQETIIETVNKLDAAKYRTFPDISDYLWAIVALQVEVMDGSQFALFHDYIDKLNNDPKNKKPLRSYLEFARNFYGGKVLFTTRNNSLAWVGHTDDYDFWFDSKPMLKLNKLKLTCYAKGDSLTIYDTKGELDVLNHTFKGVGGKVLWNQSGFAEADVNATIKTYDINLRKPEYQADSVSFVNTKYFSDPILGSLRDKVLALASESRRSFPKFESYASRLPIKNIIDGVDYDGGFAQEGSKFLGAGTPEDPARVIIYRDDKPQLIATAQRFTIRMQDPVVEVETKKKKKKEKESKVEKNRITSGFARVEIIADKDTILHPGLKFTLFTDDREVNLVRNNDDLSASPYYNNFHQVEMQFELLTWKIDKPLMEFTSFITTTEKQALFSSNLFYKEVLFDRLMGAGTKHPLSYIKLCIDQYGTRELSLNEISACLSLPSTQVEPMMYRYQVMGYVDYNEEKKLVTVKEKVAHQVLSKSKRSDYDIIRVYSDVGSSSAPNAKLNLLNYDLTIDGVRRVLLSDSHKVQIYPREGKIVMKKNRDFDFSGIVSAGRAEFFGSQFSFSYENFQIDMPIIDSLQLWAESSKKDKDGNVLEARVQSVLENLRGDLKIDRPGNKSGLKRIKKYPIFNCTKESFVYYDHSHVYNGVYNRDKFYFQLEPFVLDSLDNFKNEDIKLDGTLISADIFPDIDERLVLQPDYSLGFSKKTPAGGYQAYGGKGTFDQILDLSNKGLRGNGTLQYIDATASSESFTFFPDSTNGVTRIADIEGQFGGSVENPEVAIDTSFLHWRPYKDYMDFSTIQGAGPINLYTGNSEHTGTIRYSPNGLVGWGKNHFEGANMFSNMIVFKFTQMLSDTCDFEIPNELLGDVNFSSSNLQADVNFQTREAKFISNTGKSLTDFGQVKYIAYLDRFTWKMDSEEIEYSATGEKKQVGADRVEVEGAEFISINPAQDSLRWYAKGATYNYKNAEIAARGVENVDVADASILPGNQKLFIRKDAAMDPLDSAKVVANRRLKYHTVYESHVSISGKWKYSANGKYDYKDENGRIQVITMGTIRVDSSRQTIGEGVIAEEAGFMLSPAFKYKGEVHLQANEKSLTFQGRSQLTHSCSELNKQWFSFTSPVDPNDVAIKLSETSTNENLRPIVASTMIPVDSLMYGAFLSAPESGGDIPITIPEGFIVYDKPSKEYRIASLQKLNEISIPGNYTALNTETCVLNGVGAVQITGRTPHMEISPVGTYDFNSVNKSFNSDLVFVWEFLFDDGLWNIILKDLKELENAQPVDLDRETYSTGLRQLMGQNEADEFLGRLSLGKSVKVPTALKGTNYSAITFSDVSFKYDEGENILISDGQLGIGNIGKELLNIYVDGGLSIENRRAGADMFLYLNLDKNFYIFKYRSSSGIMQVYSNNDEFKQAVNGVKADNRRIKANKKNRPFIYQVGSKRLRSEALSKFEDAE